MITFPKIGLMFYLVVLSFPSLAPARSAESAFKVFKGLQGKWMIQSNGKTLSFEMAYDVASNGSIVTEQFGKELTVVYPDGDSLLMTHFCNRGNQPRLRLTDSGGPGVFDFRMFDITNLREADTPHVERITYRVVDDKKIELEIVWQKGKSQESEKYTLTRIVHAG